MTRPRRQLIAGNWKMNGLARDGLALARELAQRMRRDGASLACELIVCPPATLVREIAAAVFGSGIGVGGQDCHGEHKGPFTGDVSATMLKDAGCTYVIVGHSERRATHGERDRDVNAKAAAAAAAGLTPIICVGEDLAARERGATLDVVGEQLVGSWPATAVAAKTVIAYEPVWAIGSGRTPEPAEIAEVHAHIRGLVASRVRDGDALRILYGGSVNGENADRILAMGEVDGALVGGASLLAPEFWSIARASREA